MKLTNTSTIVTGGAGGLGEAVVRAVVAAGGHAVIADLADAKGEALAVELGDAVRYVRTDVLDDDTVRGAIAAAGELAPLRYAVTAHGGWGVAEKIVQRDGSPAGLEGFTKTLDLYLTGTYNVLRLTAAAIATSEPDTEDGQRGAVVTTASIAAYEGQMGQSAYAAAKAGVAGLTLVAARDLAAVGIRVVCIAPGTMRTPIMESVGEEMIEKFGAAVPFPKRLGRPGEFGDLAVHALTNTYLNGETIRLDGAQRFQPR
ncbi:SDR family NAD(P)-dependent oxidoreductase [Nocardioides sp.]|jgi:NAD(P)-dependent dehydrogenase (short-subunit alcohol dehydrogenase family)|uniref:SDR family NAD(P)-dependent oxidoreductase n=1 Tax=Nocardioides sp. TaxID=35761 RepID=UPI0026119616|nr:SDR family NAD(P)-dependent oxidoreductase [Nocardioides sp.]